MDQRNLISSMVFFLAASFVLITSVDLGLGSLSNPQAGFMPFWTSLLVITFSLILFGSAYVNKSITVHWSDLWHKTGWQKSATAGTALTVYIVFLPFFGFLLTTCVLMAILFKLGKMKIWTAALGAVLSVCCTYGLFHFLLQTPLPRGIWGF